MVSRQVVETLWANSRSFGGNLSNMDSSSSGIPKVSLAFAMVTLEFDVRKSLRRCSNLLSIRER